MKGICRYNASRLPLRHSGRHEVIPDSVTPRERALAKRVCSAVYGGLATDLATSATRIACFSLT
jgi:hypothetical protein